MSETSRAGKLIFELQVIIDLSRVIDMTLHGRWYIGGPAKIHNPLISVLYILCEVKLKFEIYA